MSFAFELCAAVLCLVLAFERATKAWGRLRRLKRESENEAAATGHALHIGVGDGLD